MEAVEVARVAVVAPSTSESILKTAACSAWYPSQGQLDVLVWVLCWGGRVRGSGRERSLAGGGGHGVGDVSDAVFLLGGDAEVHPLPSFLCARVKTQNL